VRRAIDYLRGMEWFLRRLGLEEAAKRARVLSIPTDTPTTLPLGIVLLGREVHLKHLIHELVHVAGLREPAAYYYSEGEFYREIVEEAKNIELRRAGRFVVLAHLLTLPIQLAAKGHISPQSLLSLALGAPASLASIRAALGVKYNAFEEVRYLRWLRRRGAKMGLQINRRDANDFVQGRSKILRLREKHPDEEKSLAKLKQYDAATLMELLPYYQKIRPKLWNIIREKLEGLKGRKYGKALLAGSPELPGWFWRLPRLYESSKKNKSYAKNKKEQHVP